MGYFYDHYLIHYDLIYQLPMRLITRNIFIDTQYFLEKSLNFQSNELLGLRNIVHKGLAKVYLTDITKAEIIKKIKDEIAIAYAKVSSSDVRYLKSIPLYNQFLTTYNVEKATDHVINQFLKFLKQSKVTIVSSKSIRVIDIFNNYCAQLPPFKSENGKNRKNEFPDAFALATIHSWAENQKQKTYILSGDSDWNLYAAKTFVNPISSDNERWINSIPTLSEFLDLVLRTETKLIDIAGFADELIEENLQLIKTEAIAAFNQTEIIHGVNDWYMSPKNQYILDLTLLQKDIISISRDTAAYSLDFKIDFVVEYKPTNGIFDIKYEDDAGYPVYSLNEYPIFQRYNKQDSFSLSIKYEGGIAGNFKIISVKAPEIIYVEYDDGEAFIVNDWVLSLPVIISGVSGSEITANGSGYEKFINITEAKKIFPELDIYKGSSQFSPAIGNKITGELRFESKIHSEKYTD